MNDIRFYRTSRIYVRNQGTGGPRRWEPQAGRFSSCLWYRLMVCPACLLLFGICAGCISLGTPLKTVPLPPGAPAVESILSGLSQNEAAIRSFRAAGTIMVQIPEVEATQISRESSLIYEAPNRLNIIGRRYGTRGIELTYVDNAFLLEFPTKKEYCYQEHEESFAALSSADMVREMFCPEDWSKLNKRNVRMTSFDEAGQTATLEIWMPGRPLWCKRVIKVHGAPWVLLENVLLNAEGAIIARTTKKEYHEQEGIRYPTEIESTYPVEEAWMKFSMRRVDINPGSDPVLFNLPERVKQLQQADYTRVDIFAGEGPTLEELNATSGGDH